MTTKILGHPHDALRTKHDAALHACGVIMSRHWLENRVGVAGREQWWDTMKFNVLQQQTHKLACAIAQLQEE